MYLLENTGGRIIKNIRKTFFNLIFILLIISGLTSCTLVSGTETYLKPPKLNEEHEKIYNALIDAEGSRISLRYPKSGSYLSAFVVNNIDNESSDEAIVFYDKTNFSGSDTSTLRINFLDQQEGKWKSMYDLSLNGTEIEKVFISELGPDKIKSVIVCTGNQTEKNACMFFYDNAVAIDSQPLGTYSHIDVCDINNDGTNEIMMLNTTPEGNTAHLKWLDNEHTLVSGHEIKLDDNSKEICQLLYGQTNNKSTAVYIDSYINTNTIMTEILTAVSTEHELYLKKSIIENYDDSSINKTTRQSSLISRDIDNDGKIEIPVNSTFRGYEEKPQTEQVPMTNWYIYEDNMLIRKYSGYYSITNGYAFMLPSKWYDNVTVKLENDDVIFCRYNELPENQTELLRICVTDSLSAAQLKKEKKYSRYEQLYSSGDMVYLACIPDAPEEPLIPTISEIQFCFKIIS